MFRSRREQKKPRQTCSSMQPVYRRVFRPTEARSKSGNLRTLLSDCALTQVERPVSNAAARSRYADTPRLYLWRRIDNRSGLLRFLDDAGCQRFQP